MMQIVKYEINRNILTVGFKEDNFVVYVQVNFDENKTKDELLQLAYIQAKPSIEYERTLDEHSFITDEVGEVFVPELPIPSKLDVNFDSLEGKVIDQYGNIIDDEVEFYIESEVARIEDGVVVEDIVEEDTEYEILAKYGNLIEIDNRIICPSYPSEIELLRDEMLELTSKDELIEIKDELLEVQEFIVNKQYEGLLKEGGI